MAGVKRKENMLENSPTLTKEGMFTALYSSLTGKRTLNLERRPVAVTSLPGMRREETTHGRRAESGSLFVACREKKRERMKKKDEIKHTGDEGKRGLEAIYSLP